MIPLWLKTDHFVKCFWYFLWNLDHSVSLALLFKFKYPKGRSLGKKISYCFNQCVYRLPNRGALCNNHIHTNSVVCINICSNTFSPYYLSGCTSKRRMCLLRQFPIIVEHFRSLLSKLMHHLCIKYCLALFYLPLPGGGNIQGFLHIMFFLY